MYALFLFPPVIVWRDSRWHGARDGLYYFFRAFSGVGVYSKSIKGFSTVSALPQRWVGVATR